MPNTLPSYNTLFASYPNFGPNDSEKVKDLVFGKNNKKTYITNTCTIRMSRSFNYGGAPIPSSAGMVVERGVDKMWYALRVKEFAAWLRNRYGSPALSVARTAKDKPVSNSSFQGRKGIIRFDVRIWTDATGHFTLWDGKGCVHGDYFAQSQVVELWEC